MSKKTDQILKQILLHQETFTWILKQTETVAEEILKLEYKKFNPDDYHKLSNRLIELQNRYQQDRRQYNKTVKKLRQHFKSNYDIDILGILENNIDTAK